MWKLFKKGNHDSKKERPVANKEQAQVVELINEASGKVCLPPCQIACPLDEDIQRSHAMIAMLPPDARLASKRILEIGDEIYDKNPLFPVCTYVCGLCEKKCNFKDETGAVRRRMLVRLIANDYLPYVETKATLAKPTKDKVAIIGGGPGGLVGAFALSKRGYRVTIFERGRELGGALRWIPKYRLPKKVVDDTINSLLRIAHIETKLGVKIGDGGKTLDDLKKEGYRAVFIATGTPMPRPLTIGRDAVSGTDLEGVMFGLDLLFDANEGKLSPKLFEGKRVIVIGGGNVAFDVARTARRIGGEVSLLCLENGDKSSSDGIPADLEEIEGANEEGIKITYSRGVQEVVGDNGKFKKIKCPKCTSVFDDNGFNPQFDMNDVIELEGDVFLITIGQGPERAFFQQEELLDDKGRMDFDQLTLMSNRKEGIFIGGDAKRIGFAADAMKDGVIAAESIDRYFKGEDLKEGRVKEYEEAAIPGRTDYKVQPELKWEPVGARLNFDTFEKEYSFEEVLAEARRCLSCGPCESCKGCVVLDLQPEIPDINLNDELCSGCGVCVTICPYDATEMVKADGKQTSTIDKIRCKRCGLCVSACPSGAITIKDSLAETIASTYAAL
ncbi:FAD-dependent oxidoreductase [Chloroflexota bacterium]